tara:strand:+ start:1180 stop:2271 length:1092 start_codon:yes stop_codon:yes gene_type:complete
MLNTTQWSKLVSPLLDIMKKGKEVAWKRMWSSVSLTGEGELDFGIKKLSDMGSYQGWNPFFLWCHMMRNKLTYPVYGTYKQWESLGIKVKSEKQTGISLAYVTHFGKRPVFSTSNKACHKCKGKGWVILNKWGKKGKCLKCDELGHLIVDEKKHMALHNVYNLGQTNAIEDGLVPEWIEKLPKLNIERSDKGDLDNSVVDNEKAMAVINTWKEELKNGVHIGNPSYNPSMDRINMPSLENFQEYTKNNGYGVEVGDDEWIHTYFHEITHSTGHESRLNRKGITGLGSTHKWGDEVYSQEELTAEIGSFGLAHFCGMNLDNTIANSGAYINHWSKYLTDNSNQVAWAVNDSLKAVKYIMEKANV